jgi:hypothetical protein
MRRRRLCIVVAMLLVALVVEGCRSGGMSQLYVTRNAEGQEVLTDGCIRGQNSAECQSMPPVTITNNPSDEEFWQFEATVKNTHYWGRTSLPGSAWMLARPPFWWGSFSGLGTPWGPFGIPIVPPGVTMMHMLLGTSLGHGPRDFNVIGSQETCEAVSATVTDPTEPCKGPFFFRRDEK